MRMQCIFERTAPGRGRGTADRRYSDFHCSKIFTELTARWNCNSETDIIYIYMLMFAPLFPLRALWGKSTNSSRLLLGNIGDLGETIPSLF